MVLTRKGFDRLYVVSHSRLEFISREERAQLVALGFWTLEASKATDGTIKIAVSRNPKILEKRPKK